MQYELEPFWSYKHWLLQGDLKLGKEIYLNILMLVPFGYIYPLLKMLRPSIWKQARERDSFHKPLFFRVMIWGICLSVAIEVVQLFTYLGLFELDDIFNNGLGTVIGFYLYKRLKDQMVGKKIGGET